MSAYELDVPKLYAALDTIRAHNDQTWRDVAHHTELSPSTFSRLAGGNRPDADALCTLVMWLNQPVDRFARQAPAAPHGAEKETSDG